MEIITEEPQPPATIYRSEPRPGARLEMSVIREDRVVVRISHETGGGELVLDPALAVELGAFLGAAVGRHWEGDPPAYQQPELLSFPSPVPDPD